ncbi:MAG: cache domain-containing protein [Defluviitaleaceae bacterium]|nr:cache domain-containing protein [Defluviitaleaceae bacterium]
MKKIRLQSQHSLQTVPLLQQACKQIFVDLLSNRTGAEITVFLHDTSVATTIDGSFAVGSQIENLPGYRAIAHSEFVVMNKTILGQSFLAYYEPIKTADGLIVGVLFMGRNLSAVRAAELSMTVFAIIAAVIVALLMLLVSNFLNRKMIITPVKNLSYNVAQLAKGNLNINTRANVSRDEIGVLTQDVALLRDIIKSIVDDLNTATDIYMVQGDSKYQIDAGKYQNSFKDLINKMNATYEEVTYTIMNAIDVLNQISVGNFDVNIHTEGMDGDREAQPIALHALVANLKSVNTCVGNMIEAVTVKGDLSFRIDTEKYKGDWREIMTGLNNVAEGTDIPLKVIKISLDAMKAGTFELA